MNARDRLAALCARLNCDSLEDLRAERPTITLARRDGTVIGTVTRDTFEDAVAAHEEILGHAPRRRPIEDVPDHPELVDVAYRTKRVDPRAGGAMRDWIEAAAQDPEGRAVRLWVEVEPCDS